MWEFSFHPISTTVIPAKAGIPLGAIVRLRSGAPAFAGVTDNTEQSKKKGINVFRP